eukprot:TRINITY_DN4337_c0_g4_i1.p1 TRINITY_DN4337_c0_g4~~TRINITY_DN4337_c0_g4_i1.p1  ORF type:complete len:182 (+),score=28.00 TRINITY_DN4337_c0_g4_i1:130-675(+)
MARSYCALYGIGLDDSDEDERFRMLSTECDTSDPHVQWMLGDCHQYGAGCVKNDTQAMLCFERAGNHLFALHTLAIMFLNKASRSYCALYGIGLDDSDEDERFRMLSTECDTSDPHVQWMLGDCHQYGAGCVKNDTQAMLCFERAGNHLFALHTLAIMFLNKAVAEGACCSVVSTCCGTRL